MYLCTYDLETKPILLNTPFVYHMVEKQKKKVGQ